MRRVLSSLPWVFLAAAVAAAGWIGWDVVRSYRAEHSAEAVTTTTAAGTSSTETTASTTSIPPATTTSTTQPFFGWQGAPAPLGILDEGPRGPEGFSYAIASGVVREVAREEISVAGVPYFGWVAQVYFGDQPGTGVEVVGRVLVGLDDPRNPWPGGEDFVQCFVVDPAVAELAGLPPDREICPTDLAGGVARMLEVGRQYPFYLLVAADLGDAPALYVDEYAQAVEGGGLILGALRGEEGDWATGFARVALVYLPPPAACGAGDPSCSPATTTTFPRPEGWYESCDAVVAGLIDESAAMTREVTAVGRAVQEAQAGSGPWAAVPHTARTWLLPRLAALIASAEEVITADPGVVSRLAAEAFRDQAVVLQQMATHLVEQVVAPYPIPVDAVAWDAWWDAWSGAVQRFNVVLSRAPHMAYNCPN